MTPIQEKLNRRKNRKHRKHEVTYFLEGKLCTDSVVGNLHSYLLRKAENMNFTLIRIERKPRGSK